MKYLRFITRQPPNAGVPMAHLNGRALPQGQIYMRNTFPMPGLGQVTGPIEVILPGHEPTTLSPAKLTGLPRVTIDMVLECAGNGRSLMTPAPNGLAWDLGGASPIRVGGVRLSEALGVIPEEVVEVVFTGVDQGRVKPEGLVNYQFSIDAGLARSGVPLLATHIGDQPLAHEHGGPLRLVVPGHYAMKSVKWLTRVEGVTEPFTGHFVNRYRYLGDAEFEEGLPVGAIQVRSVIARPEDGARLPAGPITLEGSAWSGQGAITRVEVSTDGGETWSEADLTVDRGDLAATGWRHELVVAPGSQTVMARATDATGNTQPLQPRWNRYGYANNVVHRVSLEAL
jgi:sulfane dehydrogenase subunit SoxC